MKPHYNRAPVERTVSLGDVNMNELLNCPFCGSVAEFEYDDWNPETGEGDDGIGHAQCTNSQCGIGFHDDRDSAVEKWNKRMPNSI